MDKIGDNIILIGMPTSGKSTVGVVLAKIFAILQNRLFCLESYLLTLLYLEKNLPT